MVTINNDYIRDVYHYLVTIENVLQKEVKRVNGNKSHVDKIVPEQLTRVYSRKERTALAFVDEITRIAYENAVVSLVSTFEKVVFAKYRTTYGELRTIIRDNSQPSIDYYESREKFINDRIDKLSGIIHLIEGNIPLDLFENLNQLREHRNYIAHGKRDAKPPAIEMKIADIAKTLDDVIKEIEGLNE